jgi:hypothetical protein
MWVALTKTNTPLTWPATTVKQRPVSESVISDGKEILRRKVRRSFRSSDVDHMRGRDIRMTRTILQTMAFWKSFSESACHGARWGTTAFYVPHFSVALYFSLRESSIQWTETTSHRGPAPNGTSVWVDLRQPCQNCNNLESDPKLHRWFPLLWICI